MARVQLAEGDLSDPKDGRREAIVLKVQNNPQGLDKVFAQEGPQGTDSPQQKLLESGVETRCRSEENTVGPI